MDPAWLHAYGLPIALLITATIALWRRGAVTDAALMAAHAERLSRLEAAVQTCERDRAALQSAFAELSRERRARLGVSPRRS